MTSCYDLVLIVSASVLRNLNVGLCAYLCLPSELWAAPGLGQTLWDLSLGAMSAGIPSAWQGGSSDWLARDQVCPQGEPVIPGKKGGEERRGRKQVRKIFSARSSSCYIVKGLSHTGPSPALSPSELCRAAANFGTDFPFFLLHLFVTIVTTIVTFKWAELPFFETTEGFIWFWNATCFFHNEHNNTTSHVVNLSSLVATRYEGAFGLVWHWMWRTQAGKRGQGVVWGP